ncbi:Eco57I restriction-modification methylase domain-containing protein [Microbacterium sp. P03]|uniref:Eco57I restriction-modification methylase domain-containing protein n=1 Tax=Microbacterium sp. P03 TaxID=3366946 RepID=UPI00374554C6
MTQTDQLELSGANTISWSASLPEGITPIEVVFGHDDTGVGEVQIAVATATVRPTKAMMDAAWKTRGLNTAMPVLVAAAHRDGVWIYDGKTLPRGPYSRAQAERQLQSVLDERDVLAAQQRIVAIERAFTTDGAAGYSNHFLFASYHLRVNVPRRPDWATAQEAAQPMLATQGKALITALGFTAEPVTNASGSALVLRAESGSRRAIAVLLDETEHFDQKSPTYQLSPVAHGLELAGREEVPWLIVLRQSTLRLYPGRDGVGVGQRGQSETYFELDLSLLDPDIAGLLPLIFSAAALEKGGSADEILDGSGRYAAELGANLRDRVYERVVPQVAIAIAQRLPQLGVTIDAEGLKVAYALTLRILFRILFQAYGEDSELLPAGRNENYDANSLQAFVKRAITTDAADFSSTASSIWLDLVQVWDAIFNGNAQWEVPAYGGTLFDPATDEGTLLKKLELPDSVLGPALQAMLTEITEDGTPGPVDFRSLQVREFGTIYEGLLESSLSLADGDLSLDANGSYVPAKEGAEIAAPAGTPYFHSASGERKATGSYFTPKIVVDHLIERSVEPSLAAHLEKVKELVEAGKERAAASLFWDFRVGDLAMGSAHFLVAAVDKIERGMRDFLTITDMPTVRAELARLASKAREALGADVEAADMITEAQLLRRQIARRCIYGLDINPLAVELSRLALWIHTFVPGLPMSSLDHGLVLGNSLTGIGTIEEALDALDPKRAPGQGTFFDDVILDELARAKTRLVDFAAASEADKSEVEAGAKLLAEAKAESETVRRIFDAAVAMRIGDIPGRAILTAEDLEELVDSPAVAEAAERLTPAHMPYLFPEVFLRENSGFDVLLGNPPWEKVKIEEHQWWGLRLPGLRAMSQAEKKLKLTAFQDARPDLMAQYLADVVSTDAFRAVLVKGPYPGLGSGGDPDLYQAFAWRFWRLTRTGGRAANVLPRGALSGSALAEWRRDVLDNGAFADVCFLENRGEWVFKLPNGTRLTVGLTVVERGGEHVARFCGPFSSEQEFLRGSGDLSEVDAKEFLSWSSTAAFPLIPDPTSAVVFAQMKESPRFDAVREDWEFRPTTELHSTADKRFYDFNVAAPRTTQVKVLAGAAFNLWQPDFATDPYALADRHTIRAYLTAKVVKAVKSNRSPYLGQVFVDGKLPMDAARIAFRDISRATDTRTTIVALMPPGVAFTEMAPLVVRRRGGYDAEAFLLGVMSSIPFDWASRRWVEMHLKYNILNALPVPVYSNRDLLPSRVVKIAGRLAAVDERYREWAKEVGVEVGTANDEPTKSDLIAELDALVSLLYGLSEDQVEHIFATFHRGWDYQPRLDAVLAHYAAWKDQA